MPVHHSGGRRWELRPEVTLADGTTTWTSGLGAQQRLVTLSMDLRIARERAGASGDVELTTRLDTAEQELARSLAELRELTRGIHPAILTQNGLGAALRSLAERSAVPVELRSAPEGRFSPEVEATAYFIVSEALANVAKHAEASRAWVAVDDGGDRLAIEVRDDGAEIPCASR
jgi:signal transduction histidine kinase